VPVKLARLAFAVVVGLGLGLACNGMVRETLMGPDEPPGTDGGTRRADLGPGALQVVATGLEIPWELGFLPGGDLLVTERGGSLVRLTPDGRLRRRDLVPDVTPTGEGGLMGLALHPDFAANRWIYLCFTTDREGGLTNRVERFVYGESEDEDGGLGGRTPILVGMPGAQVHDGCRLAFGPDGFLFVSMGDAGEASAAQDRSSLSGKILRVTDEGEVPEGNPFGNPVWSLGHRNPQGLAFEPSGRLWCTEHGPSGFQSGFDEVNLIVREGNYGWPQVRGEESAPGMMGPLVQSGSTTTWAPAGATWLDGSLFFGGLRGESLFEARIGTIDPSAGEAVEPDVVPHFFGDFGRIRAVAVGPDGWLWFATSNRDGRGSVREDDDRIVRVDPGALR